MLKLSLYSGVLNFGTAVLVVKQNISMSLACFWDGKENAYENLGGSIVLVLIECLGNIYFAPFFPNFFQQPFLIAKFFEKSVYAVGTAQKTKNACQKLLPTKQER